MAVVAIEARSEPMPGSVMATAVISSPEQIPGSQRCCCSSFGEVQEVRQADVVVQREAEPGAAAAGPLHLLAEHEVVAEVPHAAAAERLGDVHAEEAVGAGSRAQPLAAQRQAVLDAARHQFADYGFHGTTIERVAKDAGIPRPTVYELFGGKDELFAVVEDAAARVVAGLGDVLSEPGDDLEACAGVRRRLRPVRRRARGAGRAAQRRGDPAAVDRPGRPHPAHGPPGP